MKSVLVSSFIVHKTVVNHTKLPQILMSNMVGSYRLLEDIDNTYY
jgi:hypothetical protein